MKIKINLILLLLLVFMNSCKNQTFLYKNMEENERAYNDKFKQISILAMSFEELYPDEKVRELASASADGDLDEIDKIVKSGVDVNSRGTKNVVPLFWAMKNKAGFEKLLKLGADPNIKFGAGNNIVYWSIRSGEVELLKLSLIHGGNPNSISDNLQRPVLADAMNNDKMFKIMLDAGADVNIKVGSDFPILLLAAGIGRYDLVYQLLTHGADYTVKFHGKGLETYAEEDDSFIKKGHKWYPWLQKVKGFIKVNKKQRKT